MLPAALFRSDELHERAITLGDGSVHPLKFREMTHAQELKMRDIARAEGDHVSFMISVSVVNDDGTPAISETEAANLKRGVRNALITAIMDINGGGASLGNALPPAASAGSSTS